MGTTRDMAGALNHASGLVPLAEDKAGIAMDPLSAKGNEIMKNMTKEYGEKKGKSVFYASKNAGKISGVDGWGEDCEAEDGGPGSGPKGGGHKFGLTASHPSGSGPKFKAGGNTHEEVEMHIGNLQKSHPEHHVTVQNNHSGQVHTVRAGKSYERHALDGGPDSGPRQRIAMELREIAERMESARTEAEQEALMARRNQLLIELRKPDVTNDAMTNEELDKWEREKRDAHNMAPKDAANIEKGRLGGRPSPHAGHAFNQKDEDNTAGTGS